MLNYILLFPYFLILSLLLFLIPGIYILRVVNIKIYGLKKISIALVLGIVFFALSNFLLKILHLNYLFYFVFIFFFLLKLRKVKFKFDFPALKTEKLTLFLIFFGTIIQNMALFVSGLKNKSGDLIFTTDWAWHDFSWHLSLIEELKTGFPIINPVYKAQPLKDYHYFYNLILAGFQQISQIKSLDLLYRFFPFLISSLLGFLIYFFVKDWLKDKAAAQVTVFLTYFCGSFAFFIPLVRGMDHSWGESSFWVNQTFSMVIQPHFLFSVIIILTALILLSLWMEKKSFKLCLLISFLFGSVVSFKAYSLFVISAGLLTFAFYQLFIKKQIRVLFLCFLSFLVFLSVFLSISSGKASFFWAPLWFLKTMAASPDRLNMIEWIFKEDYYLANNHYLSLLRLKLWELFLFIAGNLGIRIFGLCGIYLYFKNKKDKSIGLFLIGAMIVLFIFPLLFLQKGTVWNSVQTWYYLLIFLNIFTAIFIVYLIRLNKQFLLDKIIILLLLFGLSLPTTVKTFISFNSKKNPVIISKEELESLNLLGKITPRESLILTYPSFKNYNSSLVSAFSARKVFYAHDSQAELFHINVEKEKEKIRNIFSSHDRLLVRNFFIDNKISYVFLWTGEEKTISSEFLTECWPILEDKNSLVYQFKRTRDF